MNRTEQQFFSLLRSGLWGSRPDESLFSGETDWNEIVETATRQTVSGLVFDGVSNLPSNMQPPTAIMRQLYQTVVKIEQSHFLLNDRLLRLLSVFNTEDLQPVILKGQGVALFYPNPTRRQCGDIDLYIGKKNYKKACSLVVDKGLASNNIKESHKHFSFILEGVDIELHRVVEVVPSPLKNIRFQKWTRHHLEDGELFKGVINNSEVKLPPPNFNALYIFYHAFHHFVSDGVGCRQLCDWVMCLSKFNNQIDRDILKSDLESFGLLRTWQIFGYIAVYQMGLKEDAFPFYTDEFKEVSQEFILNDIMSQGNFGRYDKKWETRPQGYLSGKYHNFRMKNRRAAKLFSILGGSVVLYNIYYSLIGVNQIVNDKFK